MRMRLLEAEVQDYRVIKGPVTLAFSDGLNVVHAPNETGKSTFFEAIWAGLALKARSGASAQKDMESKHGGTPRVRLVFELDGARYELEKCFSATKGRSTLRISAPGGAPVELQGDEADERLRAELGVGDPSRSGEIKSDAQGVWSLLRVGQGQATSAPQNDLHDSAKSTLADQLAAISGEVLSGEGAKDIFDKAREAYRLYFTDSGKQATRSSSPLQVALDREAKAAAHYADLSAQLKAHEDAVEAYSRLKAETEALESQMPAHERRLAEALAASEALDELRAAIREAQHAAALAAADAGAADERGAQRVELRQAHSRAQEALPPAEARVAQRKQELTHLEAQAGSLIEAERLAEQQVEAAERLERRLRARIDALRAQADAERARADHARALALQARLGELSAALRSLQVDDKVLAELEELDKKARQARAKLEAAAARVELRALAPLTVHDSGVERALGAGEEHSVDITERHALRVDALLELVVTPGGVNTAALQREVARASRALHAHLEEAGFRNLDEARERAAQAQALQMQRKAEESTRGEPAAILKARVEEAEATLSDAQARCERLTRDGDPPLPRDDAASRAALRSAEQAHRAANEALRGAERAAGEHRERLATHRVEVSRAADLLEACALALRRADDALERHVAQHGDDASLTERQGAALLASRETAAAMADHERRLQAMNPEQVASRVRSMQGALDRARVDLQEKSDELRELHGRLTAVHHASHSGGLHVQLAEAKSDRDNAKEEVAAQQSAARAAELLYTTLDDCRSQAQERYLAPLQSEVSRLLSQLFPGATAYFSEDYALERLDRAELGAFGFDALSQGAKEQLSVLVRLAMAQLLAGQGGSLPVLLDDPLTNSDSERLTRMAHVVNRAAESSQVILLTWDWSRLRGAGFFAQQTHDLRRLRLEQEA